MKYIVSVAALAMSVACISPVAAAPASGVASVTVSFADLNLLTRMGREVLEARVSDAVERVCPAADSRDLNGRHFEQVCRNKAWNGANQQLAQIYSGRQLAQATIEIDASNK
jgi:UrcA family protein